MNSGRFGKKRFGKNMAADVSAKKYAETSQTKKKAETSRMIKKKQIVGRTCIEVNQLTLSNNLSVNY